MIAIIRSRFNEKITEDLLTGCKERLTKLGAKYEIFEVPGAAELVFASRKLLDSGKYQAIITIGAVIKGDTDHYEYICDFVTLGLAKINAKGKIPVIFGVLTVQSETQAEERAAPNKMNKGAEFADCALEMIKFNTQGSKPSGGINPYSR